ncbi:low affinity immunoglobulin gamma Fc region receptor II-c-like isoform X4 [Micropterus salmoides]|uniref:low affinity immunoglobulin gamma Fc region receptor II-c-like isoform X4 n=1 Tax=Micropterus salmoides TaxID=27706 RepID=UPI0018EA59B0|nr:low affinity immunoglobulin gamma Fc region receptor II-c-like isoform X4 [Micropterus salmoides]
MDITTLCAIVTSLRVSPSRSQFFRYESVTLSCGEHENSSEWKVKRNTATNINEECSIDWGKRNDSQCFIDDVYPSDTGMYWCESGAGECSSAVNITVNDGSVILESPVLPVQEGEAVTLRCRNRTMFSSNLTAEFYKNGLLFGRSATGNMIMHVSKTDEGLYKCHISGAADSPDSWLAVRAGRPESFRSPHAYILLPVVGVCLSLASVMLLCLCMRRKEMDDTTTTYSTIKPGAT